MMFMRRSRIPSISSSSSVLSLQLLSSRSGGTISTHNNSSSSPIQTSSYRFASSAPAANADQQQQQSFVTPTVFGTGSAFGNVRRTIHPKGFLSPLNDTLFYSQETRQSEEYKTAKQLAINQHKNLLLTGPSNTGKRAVLVELLEDIVAEGNNNNNNKGKSSRKDENPLKKCAVISMRAERAFSIPNAFYALGFFGLRHLTATTPVEQIASAMLRHIRLMKSAYGSCITTIRDIDVLAIDSLEEMHPNLFKALDNVAREMKGKPDVPFGGIQIIATANFWKMSDIDASSTHGIYTFQLDSFFKTFPTSQTLLMHRFVHRDMEHLTADQRKTLDDYTINGLFGNLPEDASSFEKFFSQKSLPYRLPLDSAHALLNSSAKNASSAAASAATTKNNTTTNSSPSSSKSNNSSSSSNSKKNNNNNNNSSATKDLQICQFAEYGECVTSMFPAFCRHPSRRERATDYLNSSLRKFQSRFSGWLSSLLILPYQSGSAFGLPHKLNLKINDPVVFTRDLHELAEEEDQSHLMGFFEQDNNKKDSAATSTGNNKNNKNDLESQLSSETIIVRKGALGTVVEVSEYKVKVQLWGGDRRVITVLPMRVSANHTTYPSIVETIMQFPLLAARKVYPDALVMLNLAPEALVADARYFTEVNEFGNFLSLLRSNSVDFKHIRQFFERPANVHEATKNYYDGLIEENNINNNSKKNCFGTMPFRSTLSARLCKNCKSHVKEEDFRTHWLECVHSCRWCPECSTTVPLEKWEAHNEKHTVVMCLDCGRPLEWRNWALHRNTCGAMIREVSSNNELLPSVTQQTALQMGVDGRDLHTVKQITKGALPKSARQITKTHKTAFQYKATGY